MSSLFLLLLFPLCWPLVARYLWSARITWAEMGAQMAIACAVIGAGYALGNIGQTHDNEVWNGSVTSKKMERVHCRHSYDCMCVSVSCGKDCTTRVCQTCYEHIFDNDWNLYSDLGGMRISTIDRQGLREPPRWTRARAGDPVAQTHSFTNYVKAVPESLYHANPNLKLKFSGMIPEYPLRIYDYHYLDRVLTVGVSLPDLAQWNLDLANALRYLGPNKQANVIIVVVKTPDPAYQYAIESAWIGGKKNDIIVLLGVTSPPRIDWVRISSWTDRQIFKVQLRDALMIVGELDRTRVIDTIDVHTRATFVRKNMADFEYLKDEIEPPEWVIIALAILGIIGSLGLSWFFYENETI